MNTPTQNPSNTLIPVFAGAIQGQSIHLVDAHLLHSFLDLGKKFASWIVERIEEYGFIENQDYLSFSQNGEKPQGGRPSKEYHLTLDMAKELAMVEKNEKGQQARRYFIECERIALQQFSTLTPKALPKSKKALPGCLTLEQQDEMKALVRQRAESIPDQKQWGYAAVKLWSAVKAHFGCGYKEIPKGQLSEALSLLARVPLKCEPSPAPAQLPPPIFGTRMLLRLEPDMTYTATAVPMDALVMTTAQFCEAIEKGGYAIIPNAAVEALKSATESLSLDRIGYKP